MLAPAMKEGPLAWVIILLLIGLFILPYLVLPGDTYTALGAYGTLALAPIMTAVFLRERKGGVITWFIINVTNFSKTTLVLGIHWPQRLIISYMFGTLGGLTFCLVAAQFVNMSRRLASARIKEQEAEKQRIVYEHQKQLNELKDQFIVNVSHELRTPMTEVYGYLELMRDYQGRIDPDTAAVFIQKALHGCEELLLLLNNVLDASQTEHNLKPPRKQRLVVAQVVQEVIEELEPRKREEHSIHVQIEEGLMALADAQYVRQVVRNLLSNAFKYSPVYTPIFVQAASVIRIQHQGSPEVCISVKDAGPGINPDEIPLLFGKFVRLKRDLSGNVRGTGLGLHISKQLVEAMQGRIWVESTGVPGEGSRFSFTLPAVVCIDGEHESSQLHSSDASLEPLSITG